MGDAMPNAASRKVGMTLAIARTGGIETSTISRMSAYTGTPARLA